MLGTCALYMSSNLVPITALPSPWHCSRFTQNTELSLQLRFKEEYNLPKGMQLTTEEPGLKLGTTSLQSPSIFL